jgi:hypothetical protein
MARTVHDSVWGLSTAVLGGSMRKSMILSSFLVLLPATIVLTSHSSIAESTADECRTRPGTSAPSGLHWYYRVDRTNNRHCWYLHAQGLQTHSLTNSTLRDPQDENAAAQAGQELSRTAPIQPAPAERRGVLRTLSETPVLEASAGEHPGLEFSARWVDLPRSIDLNTRELTAGSNGYAAEPAAANAEEHLPPSLSIISAGDGAAQPNSSTEPKFGLISLTGSTVLVLLLLSEGLVRLVRTSAAKARRQSIRARLRESGGSRLASAASHPPGRRVAPSGDARGFETGLRELRRVLRRADAGLRPSRSFVPSQSIIRKHVQAKSAVQRLKPRSLSPRWAPL